MMSIRFVPLDTWVSLLLSLLIHGVLVWWFSLYLRAVDDPVSGQDALVMVYWLDEPGHEQVFAVAPEPVVAGNSPSSALQVQEILPPAHEAAMLMGDQTHPDAAKSPRTALDLSLPGSTQDAPVAYERALPWEREPPVEYRSTRFNRSWAPTDKSIQHEWAHRSAIAGLLLSAVGAMDEPCTQEQRDRQERHCFGEQYKGDWDTRMEDLER